jgi:hypothetical protein
MSLKARISKLEKELPEISEHKVIETVSIYQVQPSKEEEDIAMSKANELIENSSKVVIWYIPHVYKHIFQYRWGAFTDMEWNQKLGLYTDRDIIIKLAEKYEGSFNPSFVGAEIIFITTYKVQPGIHEGDMFEIIDTSRKLRFFKEPEK